MDYNVVGVVVIPMLLCAMCSWAVQPICSLMGGRWRSSIDVGGISEVTKPASVPVGGLWWMMVECCRIGFTRIRSQVQVLHRPPTRIWSVSSHLVIGGNGDLVCGRESG